MSAVARFNLRYDAKAERAMGARAFAMATTGITTFGECDICHVPLGGSRISVAISWYPRHRQAVLVPRHAPCGPATYAISEVAMIAPHATQRWAAVVLSPPGAQPEAVVVINPAIDVQDGVVTDTGDWRTFTDLHAAALGLRRPSDPAAAPTWGITLDRRKPLAELHSPQETYDLDITAEFAAAVRHNGTARVVVTGRPLVEDLAAGAGPLGDALTANVALVADAGLNMAPADIALPSGVPAPGTFLADWLQEHPGDSAALSSTSALRAAGVSQTRCEAIGLDAGNPHVAALLRAGTPLPVLLLEPGSSVLLQDRETLIVTEGNAERIIAEGFQRLTPGQPAPLGSLRGWTVTLHRREITLLTPDGRLLGSAPAHDLSRGWRKAADAAAQVLVTYGTRVGVRTPTGRDPKTYTADRRSAELLSSAVDGIAAWANIDWR